MTKPFTASLLSAALVSGAGLNAQAQPSGEADPSRWAQAPSVEEVNKAYPVGAKSIGAEGRSVAECGFTAEGIAKACSMLMDEPRGYGFGEALKSLVPKFRLPPSAAGRKAIISVKWHPGGQVVDPPYIGPIGPTIPNSPVTRSADQKAMIGQGGTPSDGPTWYPILDGRPSWERKPTSRDIEAFYPPKAKSLRVEGRTAMRCGVSATGVFRDCQIVSEEPPGLGFGEAALKTAPLFKMAPKASDGRPVEGGWVTIPLTWRFY